MPYRVFVLSIAAVGVAGFSPACCQAHDLRARVTLPANDVVVEAWFSDGTPAEGAVVLLIDASGREVASGKADHAGRCAFPRPGSGRYTAIVELIGHREEIEFPIADTSSSLEFASVRLNPALGLALGLGSLLVLSGGFWVLRRRRASG